MKVKSILCLCLRVCLLANRVDQEPFQQPVQQQHAEPGRHRHRLKPHTFYLYPTLSPCVLFVSFHLFSLSPPSLCPSLTLTSTPFSSPHLLFPLGRVWRLEILQWYYKCIKDILRSSLLWFNNGILCLAGLKVQMLTWCCFLLLASKSTTQRDLEKDETYTFTVYSCISYNISPMYRS